MILKKLRIRNFRQFKDVTLNFSEDIDKPFTILLGSNTYGKTTIIRAFLWCLYGKNDFIDKKLINKDVFDETSSETNCYVRVEIEFSHANCVYKLSSRETYFKNKNGDCVISEKRNLQLLKTNQDGNSKSIFDQNAITNEITSILDPDLSPYFFFDGETNKIDQATKNANIKKAVSDLLGLKKLELLKDFFDSQKRPSIHAFISSKMEYQETMLEQQTKSELEDQTTKLNEYFQIANDLTDEINKLTNMIDEAEVYLDSNKDLFEYQAEKRKLENEISASKKSINENVKRISTRFGDASLILNLLYNYQFVCKDYSAKLKSSDFLSTKNISHISAEAIDEIIKRGYCICGQTITNNKEAIDHLIVQKDYIPPKNYGKSIRDFIDGEQNSAAFSSSSINSYVYSLKDTLELIEDVDAKEDKLVDLKGRLAGSSDLIAKQKEIDRMKERKDMQRGRLSTYENDSIPNIREKIKQLQRKLDNMTVKNEKNQYYLTCLQYADEIYRLADNSLSKRLDTIKFDLKERVNEVFSKMYHGKREILIDNNFKVTSVVTDYTPLEASMGLNTVINFSFVTGLMSLIANKINTTDETFDVEESLDNYPLVMDAPFSNTDENHIKRICNTLPLYCQQIFIAVMDKDFDNAIKHISSKIGKIYRLEKISETNSTIKEEE